MNVPGGMDMSAVKFSDDVRDVALSLIGHAREVVKLPEWAERGVRFNHDAGVLWRLESMFDEDTFLRNPLPAVEAALVDAAKSDYWYTQEKDYDEPYEVSDYDGPGDDEGCCEGDPCL